MKSYTMTCDKGHEPMSFTTQADSTDMAYENFMAMEDVKAHVASSHADMAGMDADAMKAMCMGMIKEDGAEAAAEPAAM